LAEFKVATGSKEEKKTHSIARLYCWKALQIKKDSLNCKIVLLDGLQIIEVLKHVSTSYILLVYPYPHSFKTQIKRCKAFNKKLRNQQKYKKKEKGKKN